MARYVPERVTRAMAALRDEPAPYIVRSFLKSKYPWGEDAATLQQFQLGLELNSWGRPAVLFPMRQLTGEWFYTRRAVLEGPKYEHEVGLEPPLYLPLPPQEGVVYLTEGHPDTVTARWLGYPAMGLMGTSSWRTHLDDLRLRHEVRIVMDADKAGWHAAVELWKTLCNARIVFLYPPQHADFMDHLDLFLLPVPVVDPRCLADDQSHGECARTGRHKVFVAPYTRYNHDLTDITQKYGRLWADVLMQEEGALFGPRHDAGGCWSGEGCSRSDTQLARRRVPATGLPRASLLPREREPSGLRRLARYLGTGW